MIAKGRVRVACPVNADGEETADWNAMVGIAGRVSYAIQAYADGEEFPLETDRRCLIILAGPMDIPIDGALHRLAPYENHHVTIERGKIVDYQGRTLLNG
jgi:hypothetical protein